jgi:hypothetical protein
MKFKNILVMFSTLLIFILVLNSCYYDQIVPPEIDISDVPLSHLAGILFQYSIRAAIMPDVIAVL